MSILLKALKQAEADRQATRTAQQSGLDAGAKARADVPGAVPDKIEIDHLPTDEVIAKQTREPSPLPAYRGLWITLALAVASAAAFGYWMRGISAMNPPSASVTAIRASAGGPVLPVATSQIPPALMVQEAGPLQLRLDRQLDSRSARIR